jgi:hypothetical protein
MDIEKLRSLILSFIKTWWFSLILVLCSWFIIHQYYLTIASNIFKAINYDHIFGLSLFYFFLDNLTLILHEAGHTIFGIFGWRFLTILGGTLMQLLIPFLIVIYGFTNYKQKVTQTGLYWLGFSWLDSSAYAADAFYRQLPLIGNLPKSAHDFRNMLTQLGWIEDYMTVAWIMFWTGTILLMISITYPFLKRKRTKYIDLELEL